MVWHEAHQTLVEVEVEVEGIHELQVDYLLNEAVVEVEVLQIQVLQQYEGQEVLLIEAEEVEEAEVLVQILAEQVVHLFMVEVVEHEHNQQTMVLHEVYHEAVVEHEHEHHLQVEHEQDDK